MTSPGHPSAQTPIAGLVDLDSPRRCTQNCAACRRAPAELAPRRPGQCTAVRDVRWPAAAPRGDRHRSRGRSDLTAELRGCSAMPRRCSRPWERRCRMNGCPRGGHRRQPADGPRVRRLAHPDDRAGPAAAGGGDHRALAAAADGPTSPIEPVTLRAGRGVRLRRTRTVAPARRAGLHPRVDMVGKRGEFAVRGGISRPLPPTAEHPRVEFWGDEITEMRMFSVADRLHSEIAVDAVVAGAVPEFLLTDAARAPRAACWLTAWPANRVSGSVGDMLHSQTRRGHPGRRDGRRCNRC